ncbi:uncharacterized protein METZ01_LOCUS47560 [marine metagenome]|uniref:Uncharacterized protein n=1 Tax=marine metagenome TaxID=408172 RepID=A0A381RS47_9ZZZZ
MSKTQDDGATSSKKTNDKPEYRVETKP